MRVAIAVTVRRHCRDVNVRRQSCRVDVRRHDRYVDERRHNSPQVSVRACRARNRAAHRRGRARSSNPPAPARGVRAKASCLGTSVNAWPGSTSGGSSGRAPSMWHGGLGPHSGPALGTSRTLHGAATARRRPSGRCPAASGSARRKSSRSDAASRRPARRHERRGRALPPGRRDQPTRSSTWHKRSVSNVLEHHRRAGGGWLRISRTARGT